MKKYSVDYFEKKYKILADKLLQKEGFTEAVKETRKELGLPENGFGNGPELAFFIVGKMSKEEQQSLTFFAFVEAYAFENKIAITDENRVEITSAFLKKGYKRGISMVAMMFELAKNIESHHALFTTYPTFDKNKYLSKLSPAVKKLMERFWGVDRKS